MESSATIRIKSRAGNQTYAFTQGSLRFEIVLSLLEQYTRISQSYKGLHPGLKSPILYLSAVLFSETAIYTHLQHSLQATKSRRNKLVVFFNFHLPPH